MLIEDDLLPLSALYHLLFCDRQNLGDALII
jgi:hypothetical protein